MAEDGKKDERCECAAGLRTPLNCWSCSDSGESPPPEDPVERAVDVLRGLDPLTRLGAFDFEEIVRAILGASGLLSPDKPEGQRDQLTAEEAQAVLNASFGEDHDTAAYDRAEAKLRSIAVSGSDFPMSAERGCGASGKEGARDTFGQPAPTPGPREGGLQSERELWRELRSGGGSR